MENAEKIVERLDFIIELLARKIYNPEDVAGIVKKAKKNPKAYKKAFNALDGEITLTSAAKIAGVTKATMGKVVKSWEEAGIVINLGSIERPKYKKVLTLP